MPELGTSGTAGAAGGQLPAATRPPLSGLDSCETTPLSR